MSVLSAPLLETHYESNMLSQLLLHLRSNLFVLCQSYTKTRSNCQRDATSFSRERQS